MGTKKPPPGTIAVCRQSGNGSDAAATSITVVTPAGKGNGARLSTASVPAELESVIRSGPQQAGAVDEVVELVDVELVELVLEVLVELVVEVTDVLVELVELVEVLDVLVVVLELRTGHPPGAGASFRLKRFDWFFKGVPPNCAQ